MMNILANAFSTSRLFLIASTLSAIAASPASAQTGFSGGSFSANRPSNVPRDFVLTPFGYFHPSCVIELGEDEEIRGSLIERSNGMSRSLIRCQHPRYDATGRSVFLQESPPPAISWAWVEWLEDVTVGPVEWLSATWFVPSAPPDARSQTVYLFPGLMSRSSPDFILQPVLGWNASNDQRWTIASWNCCRAGNAFHSALVPVSAGTSIAGYVWGSNCNLSSGVCSAWQVQTSIANGASTTLNTISYDQPLDWAHAGALEVYSIDSCRQYPANGVIQFQNLSVHRVGGGAIMPSWQPRFTAVTPLCNYSVESDPALLTATLRWCAPKSCTGRCGTISDDCGGTLSCSGCSGTGKKCFAGSEWWYAGQFCNSAGYCESNPCDLY